MQRRSRGRCDVVLQRITIYCNATNLRRCVLHCHSLSFNPFAAHAAAPPFENDYRPEKSQWRNWSQCPCRRRSSHSCIHSPHSSLSEGCTLDSCLPFSNSDSGLLLNVTLLLIVHLFCSIVWPSPAHPPPCPPSGLPDPEWME